MIDFTHLLTTALQQTGLSLLHNWPYLLVGILISVFLKLYLDERKISAFMKRFSSLGVIAATGVAVATPLCSCGTTAVILGMIASTMPWAPIVAFMVSSPLTSPEGLFYSAGLFGWPFAWTFFAASIVLGLMGGAAASFFESRGWLANQTRFKPTVEASQPGSCGCGATPTQAETAPLIRLETLQPVNACACSIQAEVPASESEYALHVVQKVFSTPRIPPGVERIFREVYISGKQLLVMFVGFAFIGFVLNGLIPASWVAAAFGDGKVYGVPLAATLGLPFYINAEGSLPLVRAFLDNGMSQGAALAFLISGAGTSIGAIAGALTIARWRVVALVIVVLWLGAILSGYAFDLFLLF